MKIQLLAQFSKAFLQFFINFHRSLPTITPFAPPPQRSSRRILLNGRTILIDR